MSEDTVEKRLRAKLEKGEITQEEFDELFTKFKDLDMLDANTPPKRTKRKNWSFTGSKIVDSDANVDGPVSVTGSLNVQGDLNCLSLSIAGSTTIDGELVVKEKCNLTGKLEFQKDGMIGGPVSIAGKLDTPADLTVTSVMKVAGKTDIGGDLIVGDALKIGGKVSSRSIKCSGNIKLGGLIKTQEDVVADVFEAKQSHGSVIGGSLKANTIKIGSGGSGFQIKFDKPPENFANISDFVTKIVTSIVPIEGSNDNGKVFVIEKDVIGDNIELAFIRVEGDIVGKDVFIGHNAEINGVIKYSQSISVPEGSNYKIEKIE
jgi:predicted acyltransferase (DUF342 family)